METNAENESNRFKYAFFIKHEDSILYCEAKGSYTNIYYNCFEPERVSYRICIVEEKLGLYYLKRCHESYIVNLNGVLSIVHCDRNTELQLITGIRIPVSRNYKDEVINLYYKIRFKPF